MKNLWSKPWNRPRLELRSPGDGERVTSKYLNDFFRLKCAPDLMRHNLFPNAKEVTESFAAYWAARAAVPWELKDPSVHVVAVGDGVVPRTGAVFAHRSSWTVWSVDPLLRHRHYDIKRLSICPRRIEDGTLGPFGRAIIVAVHSHADLMETLRHVHAKEVAVVAIPCCVDQWIEGRWPDEEYVDRGVWSPKRIVRVWHPFVPRDCVAGYPW